MKNKNLDLKELPAQLGAVFRRLSAYKVFAFFLLVASLYGYIVWRINVLSNAPPTTADDSQVVSQAHIDQAIIDKLQSLQDNSVSVQSLFDSARQDPFQE